MYNILRLPKVIEKTGLGKSTIYKKVAAGEFPKQRSITDGGAVGWREDQVNDWIKQRFTEPANDNQSTSKNEW